MKKKIIWRLENRPTSNEIIDLLNAGLLSKDEAREILLTEKIEEKVSEDSLKSEIKFLRELVEKLSNGSQSKIVETIRYIDRPYRQYPWYQPYGIWCSGTGATLISSGTTSTLANYGVNSSLNVSAQAIGVANKGFSSISTF